MSRPTSLLLAALVGLATAGGCNTAAERAEPGRGAKLNIVTSIYPLELIIDEVAGDRAHVFTLLPPGASPHTFEPSAGDVRRVADASLFVLVGGGLDDWAAKLLDATQSAVERVRILDVHGLPVLPVAGNDGDEQGADPHVWLDPVLVRDSIVPALLRTLVELDVDGQGDYARNARRFGTELSALDAEISAKLADLPTRGYIGFHDPWRYFAARYDLTLHGLVQEAAGEDPTAADVASVILAARKTGIRSILIEPQLSVRIAKAITDGFNGGTVVVDPIGSPDLDDRDTYSELMAFNASAFAEALGGENKP